MDEPYGATKKRPSHRPLGHFSNHCCAKNTHPNQPGQSIPGSGATVSEMLTFCLKFNALLNAFNTTLRRIANHIVQTVYRIRQVLASLTSARRRVAPDAARPGPSAFSQLRPG
jgi:hypothetical protein